MNFTGERNSEVLSPVFNYLSTATHNLIITRILTTTIINNTMMYYIIILSRVPSVSKRVVRFGTFAPRDDNRHGRGAYAAHIIRAKVGCVRVW